MLQLQECLGLSAAFLCLPGGRELTWGTFGTCADSPGQMAQLSNIAQGLKEQRHSPMTRRKTSITGAGPFRILRG